MCDVNRQAIDTLRYGPAMRGRQWFSLLGLLFVMLAFGALMQTFTTPSVTGVGVTAILAGLAYGTFRISES